VALILCFVSLHTGYDTKQNKEINGKRTSSRDAQKRKTESENLVSAIASTNTDGVGGLVATDGTGDNIKGNNEANGANGTQSNSRTEEQITGVNDVPTQTIQIKDGIFTTLQGVDDKQAWV